MCVKHFALGWLEQSTQNLEIWSFLSAKHSEYNFKIVHD